MYNQVKVWPLWTMIGMIVVFWIAVGISLYLVSINQASPLPGQSESASIAQTFILYTWPLGIIGAIGAMLLGSRLFSHGQSTFHKVFAITGVILGLITFGLPVIYLFS